MALSQSTRSPQQNAGAWSPPPPTPDIEELTTEGARIIFQKGIHKRRLMPVRKRGDSMWGSMEFGTASSQAGPGNKAGMDVDALVPGKDRGSS